MIQRLQVITLSLCKSGCRPFLNTKPMSSTSRELLLQVTTIDRWSRMGHTAVRRIVNCVLVRSKRPLAGLLDINMNGRVGRKLNCVCLYT